MLKLIKNISEDLIAKEKKFDNFKAVLKENLDLAEQM
jgi:hypothetical protein